MTNPRASIRTNIGAMIFGLVMIGWSILNLGNNIEYLPGDLRGQPWFNPVVSSIIGLVGALILIEGAVRLRRGLRDRKK
jgi:hypothetical protein